MPFDADSGLVYTEKIISKHPARFGGGESAYNGRGRRRPKRGVSANGPHTLKEMAKLTLLRNLDLVDAELLQSLPSSIVEYLWTAIRRSNLDGLTMWKAFAPTGCLGLSSVRTHSMHSLYDTFEFRRSIRLINSPSSAWMTSLSLMDIGLPISDWAFISKLSNLKSLQIGAGPRFWTGFNDKVLRAWGESCKSEGCFGSLEAIFVHGHEAVTDWSLQYLASFPALDTFSANSCGVTKTSRSAGKELGWNCSKNDAFVKFALEQSNNGERNYNLYSTWYALVQAYFARRRSHETQEAKLPLLNANLRDRRNSFYQLDFKKLFCFERDWSFNATDEPSQPEDHQRAKKRKLKDGKALSLDNILDSL